LYVISYLLIFSFFCKSCRWHQTDTDYI